MTWLNAWSADSFQSGLTQRIIYPPWLSGQGYLYNHAQVLYFTSGNLPLPPPPRLCGIAVRLKASTPGNSRRPHQQSRGKRRSWSQQLWLGGWGHQATGYWSCEHPLKCRNNHQNDCGHLRKEEEEVGQDELISPGNLATVLGKGGVTLNLKRKMCDPCVTKRMKQIPSLPFPPSPGY